MTPRPDRESGRREWAYFSILIGIVALCTAFAFGERHALPLALIAVSAIIGSWLPRLVRGRRA